MAPNDPTGTPPDKFAVSVITVGVCKTKPVSVHSVTPQLVVVKSNQYVPSDALPVGRILVPVNSDKLTSAR